MSFRVVTPRFSISPLIGCISYGFPCVPLPLVPPNVCRVFTPRFSICHLFGRPPCPPFFLVPCLMSFGYSPHTSPCVPWAIAGHDWPWRTMAVHGWPWLAMVGHGGPCLAMAGLAWPSQAMVKHENTKDSNENMCCLLSSARKQVLFVVRC